MNEQQLAAIQEQHSAWLELFPQCSGTGIQDRDGRLCFVIYSNGLTAEEKTAITERLTGVPLYFDEVGIVRQEEGQEEKGL